MLETTAQPVAAADTGISPLLAGCPGRVLRVRRLFQGDLLRS